MFGVVPRLSPLREVEERAGSVPGSTETFTVIYSHLGSWLATRHITSALGLTFYKHFHAWALISLFDRKICLPHSSRERCQTFRSAVLPLTVRFPPQGDIRATGSAAFVSGYTDSVFPQNSCLKPEGHFHLEPYLVLSSVQETALGASPVPFYECCADFHWPLNISIHGATFSSSSIYCYEIH